ncbi:FKBP-type peptidyl-prolyl cis-trans isomerase [Microbacterium sp.]|uniref:FKBP-type peptidyl-prolyl cis-trans isomerase n=1 Tax=Microbacterium sp. TaxID=51671 RepID=UPI0039E31C04
MRSSVRLRPFAALSVAAVSALLLAGCSGLGGGGATASADPTETAAVDLCDAAAASGPVSEAVTVTGDVGTAPTVSFDTPIAADGLTLERTVTVEGTGPELTAGDFVGFAYSIYDGTTGELLEQAGYEQGTMLPQQISADSGGTLFGCATVGSRLTAALATSDETTPTAVYVIDVLSIVPTAAWGEPQEPVAGMPTVTLADDGTPTISIDTSATPPAETEVATLKKGDGYTVADGDYVLIQFRGARWSTGELFDGGDTWDGGTPYSGQTSGFVAGFSKALVGQTVGSQVLVVIPPADGYGEGEINTTDLTGETLVFVIDILGAQTATQ